METTAITLLILSLAASNFFTRYVPLAWLSRVALPGWADDFLSLVPGAVLAASLAQALLIQDEGLAFSLRNPHLLAAIPASLVAWRTRSMIWTMLTGIAAFGVLTRMLA